MRFILSLIIFICIIQLFPTTNCAVVDNGKIVNKDGLCLTIGGFFFNTISFKTCTGASNQLWELSISSDTQSVGQLKSNGYCADGSGISLHPVPCGQTKETDWGIRNTVRANYYVFYNYLRNTCIDSSANNVPFTDFPSQKMRFDSTLPPNGNRPTFISDSIPLTPGAFLDSQGVYGPSTIDKFSIVTVGAYEYEFTPTCKITISKKGGDILWETKSNLEYVCEESARLQMQLDGNLCILPSNKSTVPSWCSYSQGTEARYFNILPSGSYAREFGIVLQSDDGKMTWGTFGKPTQSDASYQLVPGSYLEEGGRSLSSAHVEGKYSSTSMITNGRDHFLLGVDGRLRLAVFDPKYIAYNYTGDLTVLATTSEIPATLATGPFTFSVKPNLGACLFGANNKRVWCRLTVGGLIHMPIVGFGELSILNTVFNNYQAGDYNF